jgi:hypothetical protein
MGLQNTNARNANDTTRARNPRFWMPHFGPKTGFRARNAGMNEIKSGIPCSATMRLYLGKLFARWVYKNTNARNETTIRFLFFVD